MLRTMNWFTCGWIFDFIEESTKTKLTKPVFQQTDTYGHLLHSSHSVVYPLLTSSSSAHISTCLYTGEIHQDSRHFQLAITYNKMSFISRQITLFKLHLRFSYKDARGHHELKSNNKIEPLKTWGPFASHVKTKENLKWRTNWAVAIRSMN